MTRKVTDGSVLDSATKEQKRSSGNTHKRKVQAVVQAGPKGVRRTAQAKRRGYKPVSRTAHAVSNKRPVGRPRKIEVVAVASEAQTSRRPQTPYIVKRSAKLTADEWVFLGIVLWALVGFGLIVGRFV